MSEEKPPPPSETEEAAKQIRETAKWILAAFGAIGALLAAQVQFSDFGKLSGSEFILALTAVAIGFTGVAMAILGVATILLPRSPTLTDLTANSGNWPTGRTARLIWPAGGDKRLPPAMFIETHPEFLRGYTDLANIRSAQRTALTDYHQAFQTWERWPTAANDEVLGVQVDRTSTIQTIAREISAWAAYHDLRRDYDVAIRLFVIPGLVLAAFGVTALAALVADPPGPERAAWRERRWPGLISPRPISPAPSSKAPIFPGRIWRVPTSPAPI